MAKVEIKSVAGSVLYTAEVDDSIPSGLRLRAALEKAVSDWENLCAAYLRGADLGGADLGGAYLRGAYLRGANLGGAYLRGADLCGAYLRGADLGGADLGGANLGGANLGGADLRDAYLGGADLCGADLRGAYLRDAYLGGADLDGADLGGAYLCDAYLCDAKLANGLTLVGERPIMTLGPIGSRSDMFTGYVTNQGLRVRAGCFFGTPDEFTSALETEHGTNAFAREYLQALELMKLHADLYKVE